MNADNKISRRDFIKTSALTGGALLASTAILGQAMNLLQEQKNDSRFAYDGLLKGVCDIHLHCRPDSRERSVDEYGFMKDAMAAGYRAVMFKSNDFSCHLFPSAFRRPAQSLRIHLRRKPSGRSCLCRASGLSEGVQAYGVRKRTASVMPIGSCSVYAFPVR